MRQALAAVSGFPGKPVPAAGDELAVRFFEPGWGGHAAVGKLGAGFVARAIERIEHACSEFCRFVKDCVDEISGHLRAIGHRSDIGEPDQFLDHELHVLQRRGVG